MDRSFNFDLIGRYFYNRKVADYFQIIPENVANDIDVNSVFERIDKTTSKIGQQYLYAKLRTVSNKKHLTDFDEFVSVFENDEELAQRLKKSLSKLTSENAYYFEELFQGEHIKLGNLKLPYILSGLFLLLIGLSFYKAFFLLFMIPVYAANLFLHYRNKRNIYQYIWGVAELSKNIKAAKLFVKEPEVKNHYNDTSFIQDLAKTEKKSRFISFDGGRNNDLADIFFGIIELLKSSLNVELILFHYYLTELKHKNESLNKLFCFIGGIDSAIAICELRKEEGLCKPVFVTDKMIDVKNIVHPLLENCVSNSLMLDGKSLLLTGSNMSGKTTFIRAVTINALLAQTINCCFASEYKAPFFKIFTSIRITDSLEDSTSYFLEEVLLIKKFIEEATGKGSCLFVLDEIFKGTNTLERISAGKSVLNYLNNDGNIVLASTHDIELTDLLEHDNFESYHFTEIIADNELKFDYKLHTGKLKTKNAIKILEMYDFPDSLIKDALKTQRFLSSGKK